MQITFPSYYKKFSCIADACPDTCCAGWQIMIDDKSLSKYRHFQGSFRNRLHNDINWKEHAFRQYGHRCAFLNEENLCDMYIEAGSWMLCDTCRRYPRHIEEFEGMREISLSLSCPEAARIILSQKDPVAFRTFEKETAEEIAEVYKKTGYIMDTHTAVASRVYRKYVAETGDQTKTVIASTASPYKFTRSVMDAIDAEKYKGMGDFELVDALSELSGVKVPQAIEEIRTAPVLHKNVVETEDMPKIVKQFLNI